MQQQAPACHPSWEARVLRQSSTAGRQTGPLREARAEKKNVSSFVRSDVSGRTHAVELCPSAAQLARSLHVPTLTAVAANTRLERTSATKAYEERDDAHSLGLHSSLAANSHRASRNAKLLVLADETTLLVSLELLELLLQPSWDDRQLQAPERGRPSDTNLFLRRSFLDRKSVV